MSRILQFYGASDDLFEMDSSLKGEENEFSPNEAVILDGEEEGMVVFAQYSPGRNACWGIGISQIEDDAPLPNWPMKFKTGKPSRGYSVVFEVEVPDNVVIRTVICDY